MRRFSIYLGDWVESVRRQLQAGFNWKEWTRLNDGLIPISNDRDVAPGNIRLSTQQ